MDSIISKSISNFPSYKCTKTSTIVIELINNDIIVNIVILISIVLPIWKLEVTIVPFIQHTAIDNAFIYITFNNAVVRGDEAWPKQKSGIFHLTAWIWRKQTVTF